MDLIQQDIFGSASEIKEVEGVKKQLIKEASGDKSFNALEIVARMILFKPSIALSTTDDPNKNARGVESASHTLVSPFLKRLQKPDIRKPIIGKVKESVCWTGLKEPKACLLLGGVIPIPEKRLSESLDSVPLNLVY